MRLIVNSTIASTLFFYGVFSATAAECDFDKPVGACTARLEILSTAGSKPSFSAEILISSSAANCSKVEWFLDNTPQTTVLKSNNPDTESVYGTSAIKKQSISIEKCTAYAVKSAARSEQSESRYGSCADNAQARALLDEFDATKPLSYSLPKIREYRSTFQSMLADAKRGRAANPGASARDKALMDREISAYQEVFDWTTNAIPILEGCAK